MTEDSTIYSGPGGLWWEDGSWYGADGYEDEAGEWHVLADGEPLPPLSPGMGWVNVTSWVEEFPEAHTFRGDSILRVLGTEA